MPCRPTATHLAASGSFSPGRACRKFPFVCWFGAGLLAVAVPWAPPGRVEVDSTPLLPLLASAQVSTGFSAVPHADTPRVPAPAFSLRIANASSGQRLRLADASFESAGSSDRLLPISAASFAALSAMHSAFVEYFAAAPGFGLIRMPTLQISAPRTLIDIPELTGLVPRNGLTASDQSSATGADPELVDFSWTDTGRFASPDFARDDEFVLGQSPGWAVIGFSGERDYTCGLRAQSRTVAPDQRQSLWRVVTVGLVSLLKLEAPAVYVSNDFPMMTGSPGTPTRALDPFESNGLRRLGESDDEVVVALEAGTLRLLGPLRAEAQCLDCHNVNHGHLLGAFTYRLRQARPGRP